MAVYEASGVEDSDGEVFKTLPPGIYDAEIINAEFGASKNEESKYCGGTYLKLTLNAEAPDSGIPIKVDTFIMMPYGKVSDEDNRRSRAKLKCIEIATNTLDMGDQIDTDRLQHTTCRIEVGIRESEKHGKQNTVKSFLPA